MAKTYSSNFSNNLKLSVVKKQDIEAERQKGFWLIFLEIIGVSVLALAAGAFTGGLASGAVAGLGSSMFASETAGFIASAVTQFAIQQTYDSLNGRSDQFTIMLNLLFSLDRIGRIGRGLKTDKVLKAANELQLFDKIGYQATVRNFAELQSFLANKQFLTGRRTILKFGKSVTNDEILSTIYTLANDYTIKNIKAMTKVEIENLVLMQRTLRKLAPKLTPIVSKTDQEIMSSWLKKVGYSFDDFIKLNDENAIIFFNRLNSSANLSYKQLERLDAVRQASRFHNNFIDSYMRVLRKTNQAIQKVNPIYWINKAFNAMLAPINKAIAKIHNKAFAAVKRITGKISKQIIKEGIIPSIDQEMFLGFQLNPIGIDGQCLLRIIKKPYVSIKTGKVTKYRDVYVTTSLIEAERFLTNPHQKSYYLDNWALGWNTSQATAISSIFSKFIGTQVYFASIKTLHLAKTLSKGDFWQNPFKYSFKDKFKNAAFSALSIATFGTTGGSSLYRSFFNNRDSEKVALRKLKSKSQQDNLRRLNMLGRQF